MRVARGGEGGRGAGPSYPRPRIYLNALSWPEGLITT